MPTGLISHQHGPEQARARSRDLRRGGRLVPHSAKRRDRQATRGPRPVACFGTWRVGRRADDSGRKAVGTIRISDSEAAGRQRDCPWGGRVAHPTAVIRPAEQPLGRLTRPLGRLARLLGRRCCRVPRRRGSPRAWSESGRLDAASLRRAAPDPVPRGPASAASRLRRRVTWRVPLHSHEP